MHDYTQIVEEELQIDNMQVFAKFYGCDTKRLSFTIQSNAGHHLPVLADILNTLIPVASQPKPLKELLQLDQQSKIVFGEVMSLSNNWSSQVNIERGFENARVVINLSQEK
jgi:hypothetical protein